MGNATFTPQDACNRTARWSHYSSTNGDLARSISARNIGLCKCATESTIICSSTTSTAEGASGLKRGQSACRKLIFDRVDAPTCPRSEADDVGVILCNRFAHSACPY
eukprot:7294491-Pyramimonas_sp.AAC.1